MKQVVNELQDYEFTGKVKIKEMKMKKKYLQCLQMKMKMMQMKKVTLKMEDVPKSLVSYEISDKLEIESIAV